MGLAGLGEGHGQERRARRQEGHSCRRGTCKINRLREGHEFHVAMLSLRRLKDSQRRLVSR